MHIQYLLCTNAFIKKGRGRDRKRGEEEKEHWERVGGIKPQNPTVICSPVTAGRAEGDPRGRGCGV